MDTERQTIYLCLAHMSEAGLEQKYVKEAFDTNWVVPMGLTLLPTRRCQPLPWAVRQTLFMR